MPFLSSGALEIFKCFVLKNLLKILPEIADLSIQIEIPRHDTRPSHENTLSGLKKGLVASGNNVFMALCYF